MNINSLEAFDSIKPKLSQKQIDVLTVIRDIGPITRQDISKHLDRPINEITGRVVELIEENFIVTDGNDTSHSRKRGLLRVA